ncbi:MAG: hypothetical protein AMXMBFR33_60000 [Candidatus Xenobia bacterium]
MNFLPSAAFGGSERVIVLELSKFFGSLHPLMVHFPIALLFTAFGFELFAFARKDDRAAWTGQTLLVLGTVGIMFTFISGNFAEIWAARAHTPQAPILLHGNFAQFTSWAFIALVALRSFVPLANRSWFVLYLVCSVIALGMLSATGYYGGELVYKYGAGVQAPPPIAATDVDLANLSLQLNDDEIAYSEMMHHIFGWLVLGMAFWLAYQSLSLPFVNVVRALGPVLLMVGGVFLLIFSDHDSWPLSNLKPITDPEVLAHKIIATLMILIGIGTSLVRKKPGDVSRLQSHLMAIFALAGGGMLFTHVHTGAPYSDSAVGVYLHHFFLGTLALSCGLVKMLDLSLARSNKVTQIAWIILLFLISMALLNYTESLPWYLGGSGR